MFRQPKVFSSAQICEGMQDEFEGDITESDVLSFAEISGDFNPLHVDKKYAEATKFERRIVHGAFQISMASEWIGMYLPGQRVLLSSVNAKFIAPLFYPTRIKISGKILNWNSENSSGSAKIIITDLNSLIPTAEILMYVSFHELKKEFSSLISNKNFNEIKVNNFTGKKIILITGATGGVAMDLIENLSTDYDLICQGRDIIKLNKIENKKGVIKFQCDVNDVDFPTKISSILDGQKLYAIIHFAWPGIPKGGLLNLDNGVISNQLNFGSLVIINLSKLISNHIADIGGRFIAIGSSAANLEVTNAIPAYSLGKSLLEDTARLLVPELARKNITINAIIPSLINKGMNSQIQEIALKKLISQVPLNRICSSSDVYNSINFLLSEQSNFITGQLIALTGGKR